MNDSDPNTEANPSAVLTSPALRRDAAVAGHGVWAGVAVHYGEPIKEQRALDAGEAIVDLSARGVVTISGPDRLSWLHSMTTQHLADLPPFTSTETLVLSPNGHIEYDLHLVDDGRTTWITTDPGKAPGLVEWLRRMQFMLRVEVRDVTGEFAVLGEPVARESTADDLQQHGVIAWRDPWPLMGPLTASYSRYGADGSSASVEGAASVDGGRAGDGGHPGLERPWRELVVPRAQLEERLADRPLAGLWAHEALRIAAWRPDGLAEVDHRTIAHELDWLRTAVHLQKGCYRGQETVARVHNLGRPPRRLAFVHLDGSGHVLPDPGADVFVVGSERPVGRLTSVARHHVDGPIGLVVLKRSTPVDAQLLVGGVAAGQTAVVLP